MKKLLLSTLTIITISAKSQLPTDLRDWTITGTRTAPTSTNPADAVAVPNPGVPVPEFVHWPKNNAFGFFEWIQVGTGWTPTSAYGTKTYTTNALFDSLIVNFDLSTTGGLGYRYDYYDGVTHIYDSTDPFSVKYFRVSDPVNGVNSITPTFTISTTDIPTVTVTINNVTVMGYTTNVNTGITIMSNLTTGQNSPTITGLNESTHVKTNVWTSGSKIFIRRENKEDLRLNVYNLTGQEIMSKNVDFDVLETFLSPGIYLLQLTDKHQEIERKKVIIE